MAGYPLQDFIRRLRSATEGGDLTDAQLLERFATRRDEAAFEVLVWRHGPLVLRVAQRLLRQAVDIEDVFQATFLTLARKASAIRRGTSVGSWLYKVAYRLALRLRQAAARREHPHPLDMESLAAPVETDDGGVTALLADEVSRLPERYRSAVVLCYLQGATTEEAARVLGCPRGTVLSRLFSARQLLRQRLIRRGVAPAVALAAVSFSESATAMPSVALVACVVRAALPFAASGEVIPIVSPQVAALAKGALQTMVWDKIKGIVAVLCVLALAGTGVGWLAHGQTELTTQLSAAKPAKQAASRAPEREAEAKSDPARQLDAVRAELATLDKQMQQQEDQLSDEVIAARLHLTELEEELRTKEREWDFNQERMEAHLKAIATRINELEKEMQDIGSKLKESAPYLEQVVTKLTERKKAWEEEHRNIQELMLARNRTLQPFRKAVIQAEEKLRRVRLRQDRQHEEYIAQRQALLARIERLEEASMYLQPADRLRDVERKLDALRREVGELRRALERPKP
jgi:RNA polymerase sigma factor (sigma-70 family)